MFTFQLEDRLFEVQQHEQTLKQENVKLVQVFLEETFFHVDQFFILCLSSDLCCFWGVTSASPAEK